MKISTDIQNQLDNLTCKICSKVFVTVSKFNRHNREVHERPEKKLKCLYCEKKFKRKEHLLRHLKGIHHNERYSCPLCASEHVEKSRLKSHLKTSHSLTFCPDCGEFLTSDPKKKHRCLKAMLKLPNHIRMFGVLFDCPDCKKCYLTQRKLKNHKCPPLGKKRQSKLEIISEKKRKISLFSETSSSIRSSSEECYIKHPDKVEQREPRSREYSRDQHNNNNSISLKPDFEKKIGTKKTLKLNTTKNISFNESYSSSNVIITQEDFKNQAQLLDLDSSYEREFSPLKNSKLFNQWGVDVPSFSIVFENENCNKESAQIDQEEEDRNISFLFGDDPEPKQEQMMINTRQETSPDYPDNFSLFQPP